MSGGSAEQALLTAGCAQMHRFYDLPGGAAAGISDSKLPDMQAGWEQGITNVLAGLSGLNMAYEAVGMHASLLGFCLESLVLGDDILGQVLRCVRGIDVTPDSDQHRGDEGGLPRRARPLPGERPDAGADADGIHLSRRRQPDEPQGMERGREAAASGPRHCPQERDPRQGGLHPVEADPRHPAWGRRTQRVEGVGVEAREALEGEGPCPARIEPAGDLGGLEHEGARAAHRVDHRLLAPVAAGAQEERGQRLAHGRLADGLLWPAPVQRLAGGVEADGAEVVDDPHEDADRGIRCRRRAEFLADRAGDAFGRRAAVPDARALAGRVDADSVLRAQQIGPPRSA
jgi:hypothetical protein